VDVLFPSDLSSCLFNGDVSADTIAGTYRCYEGGALIEQGTWRMNRKNTGLSERLLSRYFLAR
jgi:hypothetical protein